MRQSLHGALRHESGKRGLRTRSENIRKTAPLDENNDKKHNDSCSILIQGHDVPSPFMSD
jgi:hypothetical protein